MSVTGLLRWFCEVPDQGYELFWHLTFDGRMPLCGHGVPDQDQTYVRQLHGGPPTKPDTICPDCKREIARSLGIPIGSTSEDDTDPAIT